MDRHCRSGLTLIELVIALAVASLLLSLAVPAFSSLMRQNRLVAATNELFTGIYLARTEAVKRGRRVTLCKSADQAACSATGGYDQGWIVFEDPNNNAQLDPGEALIQSRNGSSSATITGNSPVSSYVSYNPIGATRTASGALQMGTITVCLAPDARRIIVSRAGRPRVERANCGD
jgi:type IV fimbrial biogenesis protein FimT